MSFQIESENKPESNTALTFGEKAVGLTFNPGGSETVNNIKRQFATLIDTIDDMRTLAKDVNNSEIIRMCSLTITDLQTAQMWAVKAATWKD